MMLAQLGELADDSPYNNIMGSSKRLIIKKSNHLTLPLAS
jgi:hypothetical protein